ncbi:dolichyl-phosphate-mannose--protein mannosyltransferase [Actinotalea sp. Marseille-Q4924]|uniref:dolichyl-phosphate-mannose--protein mannosyltransferase n=1 Tax=Actinotalea sp. Marseille-Q4924 TaxID=2866571 RepID=UPI001CE4943C|nr:phospholipid carrier-dependent glycosyltransferase [Actinotalea sp. Marseille-Q4924]
MTTTRGDAGARTGAHVRGTPAVAARASSSTLGWVVTLAVTAVGAGLRLPALDRPPTLVFDETYYVKDAWTLVSLGYEAQWPGDKDEVDAAFASGDVDAYSTEPSYVVHPPVAKLLIGLGMRLVGADTAVGWRIAAALTGVLAVLLVTRVGMRLLGSVWAGGLAGLLLALDGSAIVHSRTSLLDGFLMVLVLGAFAALLVDRDVARARLRRLTAPPRAPSRWGPSLGPRPWRLLAGVLLGLAVGTKWSALTFVAVLGLLTVGWDAAARHAAGARRPVLGALARDAAPALVSTVGVGAVAYLASWTSWFRSPGAYGRQWAAAHPGEGVTWLPEAMRSLVKYHQDMWGFHTTLTAEHSYAAHPAGWLLQLRPTSFFYQAPEPAQALCGAERCSQAVTSLGNPLLWWLATAAVVVCLWWVVRRRDPVAVACLVGLVAGWLPWFAYSERTIFTFYAVVLLPWLVLSLTYVAQRVLRWGARSPDRLPATRVVVGAALLAVVAVSLWFLPLWTGEVIPFRVWQMHMWLPGWV